MKKLLPFILILICYNISSGQSYDHKIDSLKNDIALVNTKINTIQYNLRLCDKEFQQGTSIFAGSLLFTLASLTIKDKSTKTCLMTLGISGQFVGIVHMWLSHSYLKEAAK